MKELPERKNVRLPDYDYGQNGAYFVTFCVKGRHEILWNNVHNVGAIINRPQHPTGIRTNTVLSEYGDIVEKAINVINEYYPMVEVNKYVIMPNHVHMILFVNKIHVKNHGRLIIAPTISTVVKELKSSVSKQIGFSIWQRSYHDHIIRNEADYQKIWQYIDENPAKWAEDCYFVQHNEG